ncbi:MAG: bifunctional riboflavin kinase/FAD synthetase [SAR86 cluster bacterium]|uniref:Riboflavin biosynthesis protein n=1 Tax=SAR86 cluster bacterium TaxID=2030880 RepID=A0A520MWH2_9GAMM|nr:bifunctional riboflavin kinase/FMN adenylyltransferase [Gammaproteobacteria bacterium]RZO25582.1 MAG: bifunctional riboflavin kinase/FAD synthetase [SAR86 cluster bacterium]
MYLIRGKHNLQLFNSVFPDVKLSGTIGNFDGLHLGHQAILDKIKNNAKKHNAKTIVFFTEPHAAEYFAKSRDKDSEAPPRISPWREKFKLLKKHNIDFAFFLKFNNSLRTMSPEAFISDILDSINLVSFTVGDDFRFGQDRKGDTALLREWGDKKNILIENTETILFEGERISSTRIRNAILGNNFILAENLLGRPYTFSGKIVHGQHLGRTIDVPTANIWLPKQKLPIKGVYAVECILEGQTYSGIANMGIRPTVGGNKPVLEIHLFKFNKDIYSKRLTVRFIQKIRDEKKFDNLGMLKLQIQKDISKAINILRNYQ